MNNTFAFYWEAMTFEEKVAAAALHFQQVGSVSEIPSTDDPNKVVKDLRIDLCRFALTSTEALKKVLTEFADTECSCYACRHKQRLVELFLR